MDSRTDDDEKDPDQHNSIPEFTKNEIQDAIDRLNKGKARDSNGIREEQLKNCSDETKEKIRTIFNEIAQQEDFTPKNWRKICIQVIYKKVTEKMQAITGQFLQPTSFIQVVCDCIIRSTCSSPAQNTTFPIRQGFGPTKDVTII